MSKNKVLAKLLILIITGGLSLSGVGFANALSGGGISVLPASSSAYPGIRSWFIYEAEPGIVIQDAANITNNSNKTVTIKVNSLDGMTTKTGGYTLVGGREENKDIGNWVDLDTDTVILPPGTSKRVGFTVTIPEGADVGSHPGGIVIWEDYSNRETKGGSQLSVVTRIAARMYLTVPGDIIRSLEVENMYHSFDGGLLYFNMTFNNTGNVQLVPETDIALSGLFGRIGFQEKSQAGLVLRGGSITTRIPWQKTPPWFGRYVADFRIHYGEKDFKGEYVEDEYLDVKYVFWIIHWVKILIILGILILLYFLRNLWLWLTIQKRLNTKTKKHTVKTGETLTLIANQYDIDSKKIARFNLLKWPYDLHDGDVLLIPLGIITKSEKLSDQDKEMPIKLESVIIDKGDTVKDVATFAKTNVGEIIELNHLHWPYKLKAGRELLVPIVITEAKPKKQPSQKKVTQKSKSKKTNPKKSDKQKKKPKK